MGKTKVFLCSEEETVELGEARVELEFEDRPRELPIELSAVILRDVDFPAESAADAAVTSLQADVEFYQENSDYWRKTYSLLMEQRRRDWSERVDLVAQNDELRSEVERLRQSRKEQAEKHRQKMRNLQMNFEQLANGKTRSTKLQKQLESSQNYNEHLKELISELQADLEKAEQQRQSVADQNVNLMAESGKLKRELQASKDYAQTLRKTIDRQTSEINSLNSKLRRERGNDSYWHEKYLENEAALTTVRDAYRRVLGERNELSRENGLLTKEAKKLVDDYNRLNDDINRFMEDFSKGAMTINRAVEDWNATVPE